MCGFVLLPDFVLLEIMSYLTPMENLYSFFDYDNKLRCNNLLREHRYSVDIRHLSTFMKSKIFRYLCANVFPYISCYMELLKINADFVGSRIVYDLPSTVFSKISSLHLHSLQDADLTYVLEQATQLNNLTLNNVNDTSINLVFKRYLHRFQLFTCDSSLPAQVSFALHPYILSSFSGFFLQLSDLLLFIVHMPQLKHLKLHLFDNYNVDEAERLRLLQMIKSDEINILANIESFAFISRVNFIPWSIFVRLVRSMIRLRTLFFDYTLQWAPSPDDIYRYIEIDDENWNSSAANYLSINLQFLNKLIHVSFRLLILGCYEKPNEIRWNSSFWPRSKWVFDPVSQYSYFYTLPWPKDCNYNLQLYDQIDSIKSNHSVKKSTFIPDKHEYVIGEFARLSQCFPKVEDLNMEMWCSTSPPLFQGVAQPLMHCWSLSTCLTTPGMYLSHILPFLPKLRVINLFGGIDQLIALAKFRSSTLIQLNAFDWIDASIDFLDETYFPSVQFLSIILYKETTTDEVLRIERTIERSFTHLPNLISF
ncbi:unnamed protein product, partial [Rotaria sp. Silwood2]